MADFKTALEALGSGKLSADALAKQIDKLLNTNPQFATKMLTQLDEAREQGSISDESYTGIKAQINQFRRENAAATEGGSAEGDATVFAQEDMPAGDEDKTVANNAAIDEDKTVANNAAIDEDKTVANNAGAVGSEDSTVVQDDGATQVMSEEERTGGSSTDTSGVDFDLSSGFTQAETTGGTGPAGTGFEPPQAGGGATPGKELGEGDIIKQRFKLLSVLGIGGMGKVFKAIDLLKEEARDKKPHVAIKLLNEDFKDHPEAFISLQRESSRQQKLAHPNIATIYDFDRVGGPGTPVYITMELMEGMELKDYIKKHVKKQGGLPFDEAFKIIEQLGAGLTYAHNLRLVHSDFKPGNAFYCNDGTVKTLDFGIARAVKNPVTGEVEKTLFDPGQLGALTPAYASLEMLQGEEPDTRDDTYALGCVAYELLTGKHPFNKLPATTALENGLVPAPVKGLNKKQNRALRRAVAFKREDRSPTVEHFIDEVQGKATWHKNPFVIAAGILLVVGLIAINPALDYMQRIKNDEIVAEMNQGNKQLMVAKLDEIRGMDQADQTFITTEAKQAIQDYFAAEIAQHINTSGDNYNFPKAAEVLTEVAYFYPESVFLAEQTEEIDTNKKQKVGELYQSYIAALDPKAAQENPDVIDSTKDILEIIRTKIDPAHPLLDDPRPSNAYRLAAEEAFSSGNFEQALAFVTSGLASAPDDVRLTDLQTKVNNAITVAQLNETLGAAQAEMTSMAAFENYKDDIITLADLSSTSESPVLQTLTDQLKSSVDTELKSILKDGNRDDAVALAENYGGLLSSLQLGRELVQVRLAHLSGAERTAAVQEFVGSDKAIIEEKLAAPALDDPAWESELLASIRQLDSFQSEDESVGADLQGYRDSIAQLYVEQADAIIEEERFDAATALVNRAERLAPGSSLLANARTKITSTKNEIERLARIADLKEQFSFNVDADRVTQASRIFTELQSLVPDDPLITTEGPAKLADSYSRLAQRRGDQSDFGAAFQLAQAGLNFAPDNSELTRQKNEYEVEVNIAELSDLFSNAVGLNVDDVSARVTQIETYGSGRYSEFLSSSEAALSQRINDLLATDEAAAAVLANDAIAVFEGSTVLANLAAQVGKVEDPEQLAPATAAYQDRDLGEAQRILLTIPAEQSGHPKVAQLRAQLESDMREANAIYENAKKIHEEGLAINERDKNARTAKRDEGLAVLKNAQALWANNRDFAALSRQLSGLVITVMKREEEISFAAPTTGDGGADDSGKKAEKDLSQMEWSPTPSGRECAPNMAGHGKRSKAACYDLVFTGWRGPVMVVIPAGGEVAKPFAIGRYEISVADWSKYCALSGKCKPETDKAKHNEPVRGVSLAQAREYAAWLSERTGKTYRIPSKAEWTHAANAAGKQPPKDVNCRVVLGDSMLKGSGIVDIKQGAPNGWGLRNYVGNVQEWVDDGGSTIAAGGAFSDAHAKCEISLQRPHDGDADETTGFRLVLEEVG